VGHTTEPLSEAGAKLLKLPAGIPVAGPYIDQESGYQAAAATVEAPLQISLGTSWVGNFRISARQAGASPTQLVLTAGEGEDRLVLQPLLSGNVTWDWALQELVGGTHTQALRKAEQIFAASPFPPEGLHALPWHSQPNPLVLGALGGGLFLGVGAQTSRHDLLRAVALGLCCELRRMLDELRGSGIVKKVVLTGGASKGEHFRRLLVSLLAPLPVLWQQDSDLAGARGALFPFKGKASRAGMARIPLPEAPFRKTACERYEQYAALFQTLYGGVSAGRPYTFSRRS
jgi:sugar (pentulose or hexulose) kinase